MEKTKLFENVEIKNYISIVVVLILVVINIYGCFVGKFDDVFEFDKQIIMMVVSFFLGSKVTKTETTTETPEPIIIRESDSGEYHD